LLAVGLRDGVGQGLGRAVSRACSQHDRLHFAIWQIVTYSFIHFAFWHWFGNMLGIWMFGASFESSWGMRRFLELFFAGVIGAALTTIVFSFAHILASRTR
jgi:membrane associated rhomboid family serine protease